MFRNSSRLTIRTHLPLWIGLWIVCFQSFQSTAQTKDPFKEAFSYINNNRLGERLEVSFPNGDSDLAKSTAITLSEEEFFNSLTGQFERRLIAVVTGMGLGTTGLKLVLEDERQIRDLKNCLKRFVETDREFKDNIDVIKDKTEDWMGESWNALSEGRKIGDVYFYPSRKSLTAEFKWDFEINRIWMAIGSRIIVERDVVPYILHLVERVGQYRNQFYDYRKAMVTKNKEINTLLGIDS